MPLNLPVIDPRAQVREYRKNYVNVRRLILQTKDAPADITVKTPKERPIQSLDLPVGLRDVMAEYRQNNPEAKLLTPVKYMKTVNGTPELVIEGDDPLPSEDNLVTFSHTVSALSAKSMLVVTHQVVATLAPSEGEAA